MLNTIRMKRKTPGHYGDKYNDGIRYTDEKQTISRKPFQNKKVLEWLTFSEETRAKSSGASQSDERYTRLLLIRDS